MKYKIMFVLLTVFIYRLSAQETPVEPPKVVEEEDNSGNAGKVPPKVNDDDKSSFFERVSGFFDRWTFWLNPFFEKPVCAIPGLSSLYPTYKGFIKGITVAGICVAIMRSRPVKYMIKTINEWYANAEDPSLIIAHHEQCNHPCLICSVN